MKKIFKNLKNQILLQICGKNSTGDQRCSYNFFGVLWLITALSNLSNFGNPKQAVHGQDLLFGLPPTGHPYFGFGRQVCCKRTLCRGEGLSAVSHKFGFYIFVIQMLLVRKIQSLSNLYMIFQIVYTLKRGQKSGQNLEISKFWGPDTKAECPWLGKSLINMI